MIYSTGDIILTDSETISLRALGVGMGHQVYRSYDMMITFERQYSERPYFEETDILKICFTFSRRDPAGSKVGFHVSGKQSDRSALNASGYLSLMYTSRLEAYARILGWRWGSDIQKINITVENDVVNNRIVDHAGIDHASVDRYISSLCLNALVSDCVATPGNECVICATMKRRILIIPCGHVCFCNGCSRITRVSDCPLCRGRIDRTICMHD